VFHAALDQLLTPYFDVEYIGRLVLGKHARGASDEQKQRFREAFKQVLFRSYASAMLEHSDTVKTEWQPARIAEGATEAEVNSRVIGHTGRTLAVRFSLRQSAAGWKVYDISIENLSLITNFRAQVASLIRARGLDDAIQSLEHGQLFAAPAAG
jgi:phospholipid transport system substrate-binding protein